MENKSCGYCQARRELSRSPRLLGNGRKPLFLWGNECEMTIAWALGGGPTFVPVLGLLGKMRLNGDRFQGRSVRYTLQVKRDDTAGARWKEDGPRTLEGGTCDTRGTPNPSFQRDIGCRSVFRKQVKTAFCDTESGNLRRCGRA